MTTNINVGAKIEDHDEKIKWLMTQMVKIIEMNHKQFDVEDVEQKFSELHKITRAQEKLLEQKIVDVFNKIYPVGSLYFSIDRNLHDPNTVLGTSFTWERLPEGCKLRNHSDAGDVCGTDDIDISHSHPIVLRYGSWYGQFVIDRSPDVGFPTGYNKINNQPNGWSGGNMDMLFRSHGMTNDCVQDTAKNTPDIMHIYQMCGQTGYAYHNATVNITGHVMNIKVWRRIA